MEESDTEAAKYLRNCREQYGVDDLRTQAAFAIRVAELEKETVPLPGVWYLSFANEEEFLCGVFIQAHSITSAIQKAHQLGINPGGSVLTCPPNSGTATIPQRFQDKLLSRKELESLDESLECRN